MKKILIGYVTSNFSSGINRYIYTFSKTIKKEDIQIDFITREEDESINNYIKQNKFGNLYKVSRNRTPIKQFIETMKIIKKEKYDVAYFNVSEAFDCLGIIAAKLCRVKKIIAHSHSSGEDTRNVIVRKIKESLNALCKPILSICCNSYLACSSVAAKWLYSRSIYENKEYEIIYNSVDNNKFKYDKNSREKIRNELNITDKFVIGHVSRLCDVKNQKFLLDVLKNVFEQRKDAVGVLVGDGEMFNEIKEYAEKLNIEKNIIFTGKKDNVQEYMSAFDVFLLPSKFEGLPLVGIEAQFSGLPCLFSDKITDELIISSNSKRISIKDDKTWSEEILKINKRENELNDYAEKFKIENSKEQFEKITDENNIVTEKKKDFSAMLGLKLILIIHYLLNLTCYLNGFNYLLIPVFMLMFFIVGSNVKNYKKIMKTKIYFLFSAFIVSYLITFLANQKYNITGSAKILIWTVLHFGFSFGTFHITSDYQFKKELKSIAKLFIITLSIININNLALLFNHTSDVVYSFDKEALLIGLTPWGRFYGNFYDPNYTSVVCTIAIFFAVYLFKENKNIKSKIALIITIMLQLMYIFFCESRSGLFTLIFAIFIYSLLNMFVIKNTKTNIKIAFISIFVMAVTFMLPKGLIKLYNNVETKKQIEISEQKEENKEKSSDEIIKEAKEKAVQIGREDNKKDISNRRFEIWKSGYEIFSKNVVLGIGFSNITPMAIDKYPNTYIVNNDLGLFSAFHNSIIDVFTSQGLIGGAIMLSIYLYVIIETLKRRKIILNKNNENVKESILLLTCMVSIIFSSMFLSEILYINNACTYIFWVLVGYYYYVIKEKGEK